ncbi:hypothetical protein VAA_00282 [Vibrio anguillarum 775]|nr:hypothetical protein VAA_00282 [Vibrio anguillarum 775]
MGAYTEFSVILPRDSLSIQTTQEDIEDVELED